VRRRGALGDPDAAARRGGRESPDSGWRRRRRWAARASGSTRRATGTFEEQQKLAADGLRQLCEFADPHGINVIVENHGGLSSHGEWLAGVMKLVNHPRCGTLPDFGNFYEYDRYQGVES
jgi:L-ribulose-5-phosphate 3-epimerase